MKEITRIHIAKTPYDIEIAAKKEIDKYIKALEIYADDNELLQDIEIRITELLADRDVTSNGVITVDDVISIREQLGEPKDFMGEDGRTNNVVEPTHNTERKLYRNKDNAVLGGVLSGFASYFQVNPLWLRLLFIATLLFSGGAMTFVYLLFWIIVPPAKTAAEKLQMRGKLVNLDSIRELNESDQDLTKERERASTARRILMSIIGVFLLGAAITTLIFTIFASFGINYYDTFSSVAPGAQWVFVIAYILAIVAGVLLSILFAVCAYIVFTLNFNKRMIISIIVIVVAGLLSFGTAVGLVSYQSIRLDSQLQRRVEDSVIAIPAGFSNIKKMTVDEKSMHIKYIVDDVSKIEFNSLPDDERPDISVNDDNLNIKLTSDQSARWVQLQPTLTIYGPKLDSIIITQGYVAYLTNEQNLNVKTTGVNSSIDLSNGIFNELVIDAQNNSTVTASKSTVETAVINSQTGSSVSLGTINSAVITQPNVCPIDVTAEINIRSVNSDKIQYNNNMISAKTYRTDCGSVILNDDVNN
ncbi:MAG: hypothetical protein PWQ10_372 [Patescibacteria group bacterium]|nr:hypothetical protein [Patescibacteria group bacterium]